MAQESIGARIERLAQEKQLPAGAKLAALFGVSYETLRKWRDGDTSPNRNRQQRIAEVLGVAPEVFMHGVAGGQAGEPLKPDEARLLRAYRQVLKADKAAVLKQLEGRARETLWASAPVIPAGSPEPTRQGRNVLGLSVFGYRCWIPHRLHPESLACHV